MYLPEVDKENGFSGNLILLTLPYNLPWANKMKGSEGTHESQ